MNWHHQHRRMRREAVGRYMVMAVFGLMTLAFFRLQVLGSDRYRLQSEENRLRPVTVPAPRGLITDRNGVALADNVPGYAVALIAPSVDSLRATLERVSPMAALDSVQIERIVQRYRRRSHEPVVIVPDASFEVVSALEERRAWIPGLVIQSEPKRRYPFGAVAAHVVGYVGEVTEAELEANTFPAARLGTLVGRDGLEREYDNRVRGSDGVRFLEVDALGRAVREAREESQLEPQPGETIRTSLEIGLQRYVSEIFPSEQRGAAIVMDPRSGAVLALYSSPGFDPNAFVGGIDPELWRNLSRAEDSPLLNRVIQARYPPASPWKLVVAAVAMKRGIVGLESRMPIPCAGGLRYYNRYFRCWRVQGHGDLNLAEAIQHSCDVYFYQLGLRLQLPNLLQDASALGFREVTGIDLPNEVAPIFPASPEYYNRRYGPRGWTNAVTLNLAIGQGENSQTLLGMMRFYAMLANTEGVAPEPWIVEPASSQSRMTLGLDEESLLGLREALVAVVSRGTAVGARIANLHIAGKTGTAQNAHGPDHGWFIAFAPAENPQVMAGAIVEFGEHGSSVAPIVTQMIARHLLGEDTPAATATDVELTVPDDSAPMPVPIIPTPSTDRPSPRSTTPRDTPRRR